MFEFLLEIDLVIWKCSICEHFISLLDPYYFFYYYEQFNNENEVLSAFNSTCDLISLSNKCRRFFLNWRFVGKFISNNLI